MDYQTLLTSLRETFLHQDEYFFDKHVPEFVQDGKFLGDYFNQLAVEPRGDKPPRFYHTFSPFDVISNKAPHRAVVFEGGEQLLDIDFDGYVAMRTAAMNALVLQALGVDTLRDRKVLLFGSGRIATEAVKILATILELRSVDVINRSGDLSGITEMTATSGVTIQAGDASKIGDYDVILCHTQATELAITKEQLSQLKNGAVLTSFISSAENGEFPDEVYDQTTANVIVDWPQTLEGAKDLKRAKEAGLVAEPIYVKDLLQSSERVDNEKHYTVYRSTGTPIQNMAVLKLLI